MQRLWRAAICLWGIEHFCLHWWLGEENPIFVFVIVSWALIVMWVPLMWKRRLWAVQGRTLCKILSLELYCLYILIWESTVYGFICFIEVSLFSFAFLVWSSMMDLCVHFFGLWNVIIKFGCSISNYRRKISLFLYFVWT